MLESPFPVLTRVTGRLHHAVERHEFTDHQFPHVQLLCCFASEGALASHPFVERGVPGSTLRKPVLKYRWTLRPVLIIMAKRSRPGMIVRC
jgi:hypothetical protein